MPFDSTPTHSPAIPASVMEALQQVRQSVQEHWCTGVMNDYRGNRCLVGWIWMIAGPIQHQNLIGLLSSQLPPVTLLSKTDRLIQFNDSKRTNKHVLELIDRVIALGKTS